MNLHRTTSKPDWQKLAIKKRNYWQNLAAQTNGVITPANAVSIAGFGCVVVGCTLALQHSYVSGLLLVIFGRLADLVDGWLAEATGTKSHIGAVLDASIDKLATATALISLVIAHVIPIWSSLVIIAINLCIMVPVGLAMRRGVSLYADWSGKIGMAMVWVTVFSYLAAALLDGIPGALFRFAGLIGTLATVGISLFTIRYYVNEYRTRTATAAGP